MNHDVAAHKLLLWPRQRALPAVQVKLVVLDSVTFHFRQDSRDMAQRARVLAGLAQCLTRLAAQRKLAVVLINQVTTKVSDNDTSHLIPALGEPFL